MTGQRPPEFRLPHFPPQLVMQNQTLLTHLRPVLRAVLISLTTIAALSALVTLLVWPYEADRLRDRQDVVVLQAAVDAHEQQALLFSRSLSRYSPTGSSYQVSLQNLGQTRMQHAVQWQAVSLIDTPSGVIVGEADGVLRRLLRPWKEGRSEIIGRQSEGVPIKLSCSADGSRLLSQDEKYLYLWDLKANRLIQRFKRGEIVEAVLSADGMRFYHACQRRSDLVERCCLTGQIVRTVSMDKEPLELAASPDGQHLAMLTCDGQLHMLDLASGQWLWQQQIGHSKYMAVTIRFCPRGESIVTAHESDDGTADWTVEVRCVLTGRREAALATSQRVYGAAITGDQMVQSWGANGSFCQWNLSTRGTANDDRRQLSLRHEPQLRTVVE